MKNKSYQNRAIAYSLLAHVYDRGSLTNGPFDIFVPIVKNALSKLYPSGIVKGQNISEIKISIEKEFSLSIPNPVLKNILKILSKEINRKNGREDMRIFDDGSFWIEKFIFEDYTELVELHKQNVDSVSIKFKNFCKVMKYEADDEDIFKFIESNLCEISYYLSKDDNIIKSDADNNVIAAQFIKTFRGDHEAYNKIRDIYLGSMLTGFLYYEPSEVHMDVELLLDTNFIVSLLDLNTPESTDTCKILLKTSEKLGYKFTVLCDTLDEIQSLLKYKADNLDTAVIAKNINPEDIYNACDRRHLTGTDLLRISDNLKDNLTSKYKFHIISNTDIWKKKAKFIKEYNTIRKYRNNDKAALHDAIAISYVRDKRGNKTIKEFEKVNCWFVNNAITHEVDNTIRNFEYQELYKCKDRQPEIIKVDNLLNILWLSSPNIGIDSKELSDVGITTLISNSLNSSLPKARIIKELDDNIHKYRESYDITDNDVIKLSTRIANRQINNLEKLNEIALQDEKEFARRVKEEALKQEEEEVERLKLFENLSSTLRSSIEDLKNNRARMLDKHSSKMAELDKREKILKDTEETSILEKNELKDNNTQLELENNSLRNKIQIAFENELRRREIKRNIFINNKIAKKKKNALICLVIFSFVLILASILSCIYAFGTEENSHKIRDLVIIKPFVSYILNFVFLIIEVFIVKNSCNWCCNPTYEKDQRTNIENNLPAYLRDISIEEFFETKK